MTNLLGLAELAYRADLAALRTGRNAVEVADLLPYQQRIAGPAFTHLARAVTEGQRTARFKPAPKAEPEAPTAPVRRRRRTAAQIAVDRIMAQAAAEAEEARRVNMDFEIETDEEPF